MGIFGKLFSSDKKAPGSAQTPSEAEAREALDKGLEKTKSSFFDKIRRFVAARDTIDEEVLDELEMALISSDVGIDTTLKIIDRVKTALPATNTSARTNWTGSCARKSAPCSPRTARATRSISPSNVPTAHRTS